VHIVSKIHIVVVILQIKHALHINASIVNLMLTAKKGRRVKKEIVCLVSTAMIAHTLRSVIRVHALSRLDIPWLKLQ